MSTDCTSVGRFKGGGAGGCCHSFKPGLVRLLLLLFFFQLSSVPCTLFLGMSHVSTDVTTAWNVMWKYCISSRTIR